MSRPYTGNTDAVHKARREGTVGVSEWLRFLFGLKNLGIFVDRDIRGAAKPIKSVHATYRAMDLGGTPEQLKKTIDWVYKNRDALGIEEIHDYAGNYLPNPKGFGAGYRCSRDTGGTLSGWKVYDKNTIGSPGAAWVHLEVSPAIADTPRPQIDTIFSKLLEA